MLHPNTPLRETLKLAASRGIEVSPVHKTGEVQFRIPGRRPYRTSANRRDTGKSLASYLKELLP